MKSIFRVSLARLAIITAALAPARAEIVHQFTPLRTHRPHVEQPAASRSSGMLALGMEACPSPDSPPALWSGWFSWTPQGAFLSYAGGTLSTTDIHSPSGAAIKDVRGATYLASALDVMVESSTGETVAVTLHSGLLFWTPSHLYFLFVGSAPTVHEVTTPEGCAIAEVRGVACMAAQVIDMDRSSSVNAVLCSEALVYTDTRLFLTRTHTVVSTNEITLGGPSIDAWRMSRHARLERIGNP